MTNTRPSVSFKLVKQFVENVERLSVWFPTIKFESTDTICRYKLDIGNGLHASVSLYVGKDEYSNTFAVGSSEWLVKINSYENEYYCRDIPTDMSEHLGSFAVWSKRIQPDSLLGEENIDFLATFMSLLWVEIFERRVKGFGLIAGSWLSGVILV